MKKITKLVSLLLCAVSLCMLLVPAYAASPSDIMLLSINNALSINSRFWITESGVANIYFTYTGIKDVTMLVKAKVKLQKKSFLFFWSDVDIGIDNNTWYLSSAFLNHEVTLTHQLESKGTYRALINYTIIAVGDSPDDVGEMKPEAEYK